MKLHGKKEKNENRGRRRSQLACIGIAAAVLLVILANFLINLLPSGSLEADVSSKKIYSVSDTSKEYLESITDDVELILIGESGTIDERIEKFAYTYASLSSHISVQEIDPVKNPAVLTKYETEEDNLVVYCPGSGKYTSIPFTGTSNCLIQYSFSYSTYSYSEYAFDADGQITSAIDYVTGDSSGSVFLLTGHGETSLPDNFRDLIVKSNITIESDGTDLLLNGGVPENCDLLICYNPSSDLSMDEVEILEEYMRSGGCFMLVIDEHSLTNFNSLMKTYGMEMEQGYIGDTSRFYQQYYNYYGYFCIAPETSSTSPLTYGITANTMTLSPHGMFTVTPERDTIYVDEFLTTSSDGLIFYDDGSYTEGLTFTIGAVAEEETENGTSRFTVITSAYFLSDDITDTYPSMANLTVGINAVTANFDDINSISIPSKSLSVRYITVSGYAVWGVIFIGVIPLAIIAAGLVVWIRRRRR